MKRILLLLLMLLLPMGVLADYQPDANYWTWYASTSNWGYFISKTGVTKLSSTANQDVYRATVEVVSGLNVVKPGRAIVRGRVEVIEDHTTGDVYFRWIDGFVFDENKKFISKITPNYKNNKIIYPSTRDWKTYEMILATYKKQIQGD